MNATALDWIARDVHDLTVSDIDEVIIGYLFDKNIITETNDEAMILMRSIKRRFYNAELFEDKYK